MNLPTKRAIHISTLLVGGTGIVYAWMRYFAKPVDEFSIVNHPWQPFVQHLHIWAAPALVLACGYILSDHAWRYFRRGVKTRRPTGLSLLLSCSPMILSGYFIQTSVTATWRLAWIVVHIAASVLFLVAYVFHQLGRRRRARSPGSSLVTS